MILGSINAVYVLLGMMILGVSAGILGVFAVLRKQGLLADTLAHSSLPGIVMAFLIMKSKFLPGLLLGALCSGILAAFFVNLLTNRSKLKMDAAMAGILSVFFGIGILLLTYVQKLSISSQSGLGSFLFGQAASLLKQDVYLMAGIFLLILIVVIIFWKELKLFIFDPEYFRILGFNARVLEFVFMSVFVLSILMSLQAVGVVLTTALFITPAVSALLWSKKFGIVVVLSAIFGLIAGVSGAFVSDYFVRMPTGPVVVVFLSFIFFLSILFAPKKGIISRFLIDRTFSLKIQGENVLAKLYRNLEQGTYSVNLKSLGYKGNVINYLKRKGLVKNLNDKTFLTENGEVYAKSIIEKHRLWETYLVNKMHLPVDHVHRDAEEMEHILTDEMVAELKTILRDPIKDPHGKFIK